MIASTGDVFRVNFYHRGRKEEEGGRRKEEGGTFSRTFRLTLREETKKKMNFFEEERKKKRKKEGKKTEEKTRRRRPLLNYARPRQKHLTLLRSLGPAIASSNERIRSIHFPTTRNGLEVNFGRKWIKSFRVELVATDERHAAPRVAFQFCNENVKRRERETNFPSKSDLQKWQRFCSTRARRDTPCSRLKIWIGSEIRRKPWQKPSSTFYCTRFLLFPSLYCILGRHQNAFDERGQIFPLSLFLSLPLSS